MLKKSLRLIPFILVMVTALIVPMASTQDADTIVIAPGDDVVLGLATILSGEGLVPLGDDITRGVELAIGAHGPIMVGETEFPIVLEIEDDACSAEGGQAVANAFVSNPAIVGVVGPTCSSACRAAGPIFDAAGYTSISSSCTAPDLTAEDTGFASFNRTTPNDTAQGAFAAEYIYNELGFMTIATIHDGSPYGEGLANRLAERFEELGGTVAIADAINVGDTDFRNLLDTIAGAEVELVYFGGFPAEASRLAQQRVDVGLEDVPFMGADGINTPEFISLAGEAGENVFSSSPVPPASSDYATFVELYTETYGLAPTAAFHAYSFDATNMLIEAIETTGTIDADGNLVLSRAAIMEFVRSYGAEEPVSGLSGMLTCDGTGECAQGGFGMFQVQDGAYTLIFQSMPEDMMEPMATEEMSMEPTAEATPAP
jgi:branched-chain amino acid transport system substrate-binding protein